MTDRAAGKVSEARKLQRSGVVQVDTSICVTCRECEVACSLFHENECNPALSSIQIDFDDFVPGLPDIRVCKQCDWPACYYACHDRWPVNPTMTIDPESGARYVDASTCRGCGSCIKACPLTPEREVMRFRKVGRKRQYIKCDLCRGRDEGPVCVQVCPAGALSFIPAEERK